jgi:hypothetical protein
LLFAVARFFDQDPYWAECQEKVVDRIVDRCGRSDLDGSEIHRMIGILETNAYEINSQGSYGFRGLFPLVSREETEGIFLKASVGANSHLGANRAESNIS